MLPLKVILYLLHTSNETLTKIQFDAKACGLKPERDCQTEWIRVEGAQGWTPTMYIRLVQDFGLDMEVALHLQQSYGDRAFAVAKMAGLTGKRWPIIGRKLHPEFPYIDAEVRLVLSIELNNFEHNLGSKGSEGVEANRMRMYALFSILLQ